MWPLGARLHAGVLLLWGETVTYEWQKKPDDGEYPTLTNIDLQALKKALQGVMGREDIRIKQVNHQSYDDHVYVSLGVEVR